MAAGPWRWCLLAGLLAAGCGSGGAGSPGTGGSGSSGSGGATGSGGVTGSGGATGAGSGLFTAAEPWTKDVSGLTKDGSSDAIIAALDDAGGWGGGRLQIDFSIPLFFADASTPLRTISGPAPGGYSYCYGGPDCDPVPFQMPIPANGNAEGSTSYTCDTSYQTDGQGDCHILVAEPGQQKLYELYNATAAGGGIDALVAIIWDLTKAYPDNERGDQCTSADAAGFPIAGLLPTADDVAAGAVDHALRFILPNGSMRNKAYVHPASHAGTPSSPDPNAPPYGVRFRLKAGFDDSAYDAGEKVIIAAMKKYGMLLSDGGTIALTFADDRTTTAKWADLGVTALSFSAITPDDFEVVDFGAPIAQTNDCVRDP
ncbi:MAG TPA: hypothetical protein VHO06_05360 [Polyangia bacterium]|nr:hypothetical protein [Polyangia bacterium]